MTTMSAAILCPAVCVSDIIHKDGLCVAKVSSTSDAQLFLLSLIRGVNQQCCAGKSSDSKQKCASFV